jgi:hypothetical protein
LSLVAIIFCLGAVLGAIFALVWLTAATEPECARDTERAVGDRQLGRIP